MADPTQGPFGTALLDDFTRVGLTLPALVQNVGIAGSTTAAATLPMTIASGHVPTVGNHLIGRWSGTNPLATITDPVGNTWQYDSIDTTGSSPGIFSCKVVNAYSVGNIFTANCTSGKNRILAIDEFSGLDPLNWFVFKATVKSATSTAPSTNTIRTGSMALSIANYGVTTIPTGTAFVSGGAFTSLAASTSVFGSYGQYFVDTVTGGGGTAGAGTFGSSVVWRGVYASYASKYSLGSNWTTPAPINGFGSTNQLVINSPGSIGLVAPVQTGSISGSAYYNNTGPLTDCEVWAVNSQSTDTPIIGLRMNPLGSPTGGYYLRFASGSTVSLYKNGFGSTPLATWSLSIVTGRWWALSCVGSTITGWNWNGAVWQNVGSVTDTDYTTGYITVGSQTSPSGLYYGVGGGSLSTAIIIPPLPTIIQFAQSRATNY